MSAENFVEENTIVDAILLAAGTGRRFSDGLCVEPQKAKQFQMVAGAPVFVHSLKALLSLKCFRQVIIVLPEGCRTWVEEILGRYLSNVPQGTLIRCVTGGTRRQDSSYLSMEAIEAITPHPTRVLIHDACRPIMSAPILARVKRCLFDRSYAAWVPIVPVHDTLKRVEKDRVIETVDRATVHRVQTPQVFEYTVIRSLVEKARNDSELTFTDDASLCEYYGIPVGVFDGDVRNMKLTYAFELQILQALLKELQLSARDSSCESEWVSTSIG